MGLKKSSMLLILCFILALKSMRSDSSLAFELSHFIAVSKLEEGCGAWGLEWEKSFDKHFRVVFD